MMSNEEFERKMAFIMAHQEEFASDMQQLQAAQAQTENIVTRLANATLDGFSDVGAKMESLVDSQIRTDETLRNLIAVVDRYFSEGRNGE